MCMWLDRVESFAHMHRFCSSFVRIYCAATLRECIRSAEMCIKRRAALHSRLSHYRD